MDTLSKKPGRRLFLLVSSGFISGTLEAQRDAITNQALHNDIVINALDAKGLYADTSNRATDPSALTTLPTSTYRFEAESVSGKVALSNDVMTDLAQATGGLFFHDNNDLEAGFHLLGAMPDITYSLAFHTGTQAADGQYHKLKVGFTSSRPYALEARPGYFSASAQPSERPSLVESLDKEVMNDSQLEQMPSAVSYKFFGKQKGLVSVKVQVHVGLSTLQFPKRADRRVQRLAIVVALLDGKGNLVTAEEGFMDLALTDATYARLSASGVNAGLALNVPPGEYRLRGVVQEQVEGKMSASAQTIQVR